jgi:putative ABC transport system substrate-binding protein
LEARFSLFRRSSGLTLVVAQSFRIAVYEIGHLLVARLRGASVDDVPPGDLPVEQPTEFLLTVNQTLTRSLRIAIPPMILARANEVIE